LLNEHQEAIDDLMDTSQELVALCSDNFDVSAAVKPVEEVTRRYEALKQTVKQRLGDLEVMFKRIFTDVSFLRLLAGKMHLVSYYQCINVICDHVVAVCLFLYFH
jgi:hypothetical protein